MRTRAVLGWLVCAVACSDDPVAPGIARFDRPTDVAFVCVIDEEVTALEHCRGDTHPRDNDALHALVTQSARGEIAAVNLERHKVLDSRRDIPGFTFVPVGEMPLSVVVPARHPFLTYVADFGSHDLRVLRTQALVSNQPQGPEVQVVPIRVPDPSGGTRSVAPTALLLSPDERALFVAVPEAGLVLRLPIVRCFLPPEPGCDEGFIDEQGITAIDLSGSRARATIPPPFTPPQYEELCDFERSAPSESVAVDLDPAALALAPRPSALALQTTCDAGGVCSHRMLASDEALPLIHVINLDALSEVAPSSNALLDPLVVGVPTTDLAATPEVPATVEGEGTTRYVYAIDATDGSVLVVENGSVLRVTDRPQGRSDRIPLGGPTSAAAVELEIVSPHFDPSDGARQYVLDPDAGTPDDTKTPGLYCKDQDGTALSSNWLRGVFLTVATSDGRVHVVDVYDMSLGPPEAPCRDCDAASDELPLLARHHPRIASEVAAAGRSGLTSIVPVAQAQFVYERIGANIRSDGSTANPNAAGLDCLACPEGLEQVYPVVREDEDEQDAGVIVAPQCPPETPALVCAAADPWTAADASWEAVYEGMLPGSLGGRGRFVLAETIRAGEIEFPQSPDNRTGGPEFFAEHDFCSLGVLGRENMATLYEEYGCTRGAEPSSMLPATVPGDQLVIRSQVLEDARLEGLPAQDRERCAELRTATQAEEDPKRIAFEIRRAYQDRVVLSEALVEPIGGTIAYGQVLLCVGAEALAFEIRALDAFTVASARFGFAHRVHANATGRCEPDPAADPLLRGRAWPGCKFRTYGLELQPRRPAPDALVSESPQGLTLSLFLISPEAKLVFEGQRVGFGAAYVVPVQLRYSDTDRRLYMIDVHDRGLVPIPLDPFPARLDARSTFN